MKKSVDALDRLVVFVAGVLLAAVGVLAIGLYLDVPLAQHIADLAEFHNWLLVPEQKWYVPMIVGVGTLALIASIGLLGLNAQRNRIRRIATSATDATGSIEIDLSSLAGAVADSFEALPKVIRTQSVVREDRGRRQMIITATADPLASLTQIREHAELSEADIRAAIGDVQLDIQFRIHFAPVSRKPL